MHNSPLQARSTALMRSNQAKDRVTTELREGSKILEDQLRLMDEKVLTPFSAPRLILKAYSVTAKTPYHKTQKLCRCKVTKTIFRHDELIWHFGDKRVFHIIVVLMVSSERPSKYGLGMLARASVAIRGQGGIYWLSRAMHTISTGVAAIGTSRCTITL